VDVKIASRSNCREVALSYHLFGSTTGNIHSLILPNGHYIPYMQMHNPKRPGSLDTVSSRDSLNKMLQTAPLSLPLRVDTNCLFLNNVQQQPTKGKHPSRISIFTLTIVFVDLGQSLLPIQIIQLQQWVKNSIVA
jgi:hypothetical protein